MKIVKKARSTRVKTRRRAVASTTKHEVLVAPRIVVNPSIQRGQSVIQGTRVPVHVIVSGLAGGASHEEICHSYGVTEKDVRAALAYAAHVLEEEHLIALPR